MSVTLSFRHQPGSGRNPSATPGGIGPPQCPARMRFGLRPGARLRQFVADSGPVQPRKEHLLDQQHDRGGGGQRDQRADHAEQGAADQYREHGDQRGHPDTRAEHLGREHVVLDEPVRDEVADGGDAHRQRHGERGQGDQITGDERTDHRHQVQQREQHRQQQRVRHPEGDQPDEGDHRGDHRDHHVAQHVTADLDQDLIADQDRPRPPGVRHEPVQVARTRGRSARK